MPTRPSEPLLTFLRDVIRQKGYTTAELADRCGIDRADLKRRLAGAEPLTVDEFVQIANALELSPTELGLAGEPPGPPRVVADGTPEAPSGPPAPDPLGNLAEQVLRMGFALGVDLFLHLDATQLADSGVPPAVRKQFPELLPLALPAKWHRHNRPRFEADSFECVLSFDRLYTCTFPWTAFRAVRFDLPVEAAPPPTVEPPAPARPTLRVIK